MAINAEKCRKLGIENPRVRGSIPRLATIKIQALSPVQKTGLFAFWHCSGSATVSRCGRLRSHVGPIGKIDEVFRGHF
jgi:hypothetical protein